MVYVKTHEAETLNLHGGLVYSEALKYTGRSYLDLDDLLQEARIGMIQGIRTYDASRGTKLSTHLTWRIRGALEHAVRKAQDLTITQDEYEGIGRILNADTDTPAELAKELGLDHGQVLALLQVWYSTGNTVSFDEAIDDGEVFDLHDLVADPTILEDVIMDMSLVKRMLDEVKRLDYEEREVIELRFFQELTYEEIADIMGVSRRTVVRREAAGLDKLKAAIS